MTRFVSSASSVLHKRDELIIDDETSNKTLLGEACLQ